METASVTAQGVGPDSQALRTGSSLMVIGAVAFIGYAILFFILNFTSFLELGIGDEQVDVGKDQIEAFSPSLHDYVSHLHIALSGFIAATGLLLMGVGMLVSPFVVAFGIAVLVISLFAWSFFST